MTALERRAALSLASIFAFRMLGLFMILPVFSLYARTLGDTSPVLIGLAIGAYGLTQAILAVPYGMASDRLGRKRVIAFGLVLFALGSVVAATAHTIEGIIAGRALQGSGAIAAAVMAFAADVVREEHRTKAMAMIGMTIGLSFALSLALGPVLDHWVGVPGIFWLTAVLALVGIAVLYLGVPVPERSRRHRDTEPVAGYFREVLRDLELLRLDGGIFVLHCVLTATFVALPIALRDDAGLASARHSLVYLPVLLASLAAMIPFVLLAEKRRRLKQVFVAAILAIAASQLVLCLFYRSLAGIVVALLIFFVAFNLLEALLPSLLAKFAPGDKKGTAMGVFSTSQFLGAFTGGVAGGWMFGHFGPPGTFGFCLICALAWFLWARPMAQPRYLSSRMISVGEIDEAEAARRAAELRGVNGVAEVVVVAEEGVAYLKVDSRTVDHGTLEALSQRWRTGGRAAGEPPDDAMAAYPAKGS
jgi:predicted MFS family arabinose efflux permease